MRIDCYRLEEGAWKRFNIIAKTPSVVWTRRFTQVGSFVLQLKENVLKPYDIVVQGQNAGLVMKTAKPDGIYTAYGYDLKGVANFRQFEEETITSRYDAGSIMRNRESTYLQGGKKKIEGLAWSDNTLGGILPEGTVLHAGKLSDAFEEICKIGGIGWDIFFRSGELLFEVIVPREKTEIVFSKKRRNIENAERITDCYDEVNSLVSDTTIRGIKRREGAEIVAASDYITATAKPNIYSIGIGNSSTEECRLGDYVTVEDDDGVRARLQITEVQFVYEPNNIIVIPSFGEVKQNIMKKLMKG